MPKLIWDDISSRDYETGLDRGVFYPLNGPGHVWNGLVSVEESPSEADSRPRYLDGKRIANRGRVGEFAATISAYTYPQVFSSGMISPQVRSHFSLSYRVQTATGYHIHLVYNAHAVPSQRNFVFDDVTPFQWDLTTRGMPGPDGIVVSHFVIDTAIAYPDAVADLESILYGTELSEARMPDPFELFDFFESHSILLIVDNGDGTWTATGPPEIISMLDPTTFQISWPSAVYVDAVSYTLTSL